MINIKAFLKIEFLTFFYFLLNSHVHFLVVYALLKIMKQFELINIYLNLGSLYNLDLFRHLNLYNIIYLHEYFLNLQNYFS